MLRPTVGWRPCGLKPSLTPMIHFRLVTASWTVLLLMHLAVTFSKTRGAMSATVVPLIQRSLKNRRGLASPNWMCTRLSKMPLATSSLNGSRPCHGLLGSVLRSHSHLTHNANAEALSFLLLILQSPSNDKLCSKPRGIGLHEMYPIDPRKNPHPFVNFLEDPNRGSSTNRWWIGLAAMMLLTSTR